MKRIYCLSIAIIAVLFIDFQAPRLQLGEVKAASGAYVNDGGVVVVSEPVIMMKNPMILAKPDALPEPPAAPNGDLCDGVDDITLQGGTQGQYDKDPQLQAKFDAYEQYPSKYKAGVYCLKFNILDSALTLKNATIFTVKNMNHVVHVKGLQLEKNREIFSSPSSLLTVQGLGHVILTGAQIDGADKKNACLTVQTKGAVVSGGEYHNCADGIRVEADDVKITAAAKVHDNSLGVHIASTVESRFVVGAAV